MSLWVRQEFPQRDYGRMRNGVDVKENVESLLASRSAGSKAFAEGQASNFGLFGLILVTGIAAFPGLALLAVFVVDIGQAASSPEISETFRASNLAFTGTSKAFEWLFPVVLAGGIAAICLLAYVKLKSSSLSSRDRSFVLVQGLLALPFFLQTLVDRGVPLSTSIDSPAALLAILQLGPALLWVSLLSEGNEEGTGRSPYLSVFALAAFSGIAGLGLARGVLYFSLVVENSNISATIVSIAPLILVTSIGISAFLLRRILLGYQDAIRGRLVAVVGTLTVAAVPLLAPAPLSSEVGLALPQGTDMFAWALVLGFVVVIIALEAFWRARSGDEITWSWMPTATIAIGLSSTRGRFGQPTISPDDYHFGELFTPWRLWVDAGIVPYVDQDLPRGFLANVIPGAFNSLLNDGSAARLDSVTALLGFVVCLVAMSLLRSTIGLWPAAAMVGLYSLFSFNVEAELLIVSATLWIIGLMVRQAHPVLVGMATGSVIVISVVLMPMMGLVSLGLLAGVYFAGLFGGFVSRANGALRREFVALGTAMIIILTALLSPVGGVIYGGARYVISNAGSNSEAFGVALEQILDFPFAIWHLLGFSFMAGVVASLWMVAGMKNSWSKPSVLNYRYLAIALIPLVFSVVLYSRYMGRIDPMEWSSRPSGGSLLVLGVVIPAVALIISEKYSRFAWTCIGIAAVVSAAIAPVGQAGLVRSSLEGVNSTGAWIDEATKAELPFLGTGAITESHIASLREIAYTERVLPPGEPVLNLTNRGALFAYFGWANPISYLAVYNIESGRAESAVVESLNLSKPRYALLAPGVHHDGLSLSLRNPELARWVMSNYTPVLCGSHLWAVEKSAYPDGNSPLRNCEIPGPDGASVQQLWQLAIGGPESLQNLTASWGDSAVAGGVLGVSEELEVKTDLSTSSFLVQVPSQAELLYLDLTDCMDELGSSAGGGGSSSSSAAAFFPTTFSVTFALGGGHVLFPLDAYPNRNGGLDGFYEVRIELAGLSCSGDSKVSAAAVER